MAKLRQASTESEASTPSRSRLLRYPVAVFLGALAFALVSAPFEGTFNDSDLFEAIRLTVVLLFGLLALSGRRQTLIRGICLLTPVLLGKWLNHWRADLVPAWGFLVPGLVFIGYVIVHLLLFILRAPRIDSEVLCAGVAGYLMVGLLWSLAYLLTATLAQDSFAFSAHPGVGNSMKGFTAIYFSFITLTTVGYGDIVPVSGVARMLAMMEAITGVSYMAVLISRLVAVYSSHPPATTETRPPGQA